MTRTVKQLFDLTGQTALVTGGSRGLGLQMAHALGEAGARLMLSSRKADDLQEAVAELKAAGIHGERRRRHDEDHGAVAEHAREQSRDGDRLAHRHALRAVPRQRVGQRAVGGGQRRSGGPGRCAVPLLDQCDRSGTVRIPGHRGVHRLR